MNIEVECAYPLPELYANIAANSRVCTRWLLQPESSHEGHAVLVGGGPSLEDKLHLVKRRIDLGQTVFALNGACKYLNKHGIVPDYQVFLDANKEMGDRIGEAKQYLVASQCAPELLASLPPDKVELWHFALPDLEEYLPDEPAVRFNLIGGGVTIGLTAMCLSYAMGYRKLHLFGYDSSNREGKDHAYDVPLTEERVGGQILNSVKVTFDGKIYESTLAMTRQAELFPTVCNGLIDMGCIITVDSDGLIKAVLQHMTQTAAEAA